MLRILSLLLIGLMIPLVGTSAEKDDHGSVSN